LASSFALALALAALAALNSSLMLTIPSSYHA
jgi:hypothetical protein